jgi:hypothetical protein
MSKKSPRSKRAGVVDTANFPRGKPSGIVSATNPRAPLENATDVGQSWGPNKKNPPRGLKPPIQGPHQPR